MLVALIAHGVVVLFFLLISNKWYDNATLLDICFYGLLVEFFFSSLNLIYIYYSNFLFILNIGSLSEQKFFFKISLNFFFDEISNVFHFILSFALVLCFFFLIEYFEYDINSTGIILLSSLFSQVALWFFCVYDIFLLIFFWESISIISFFLIQYWSFRIPSYKAAIKVFFISQIGDLPFFFFFFFLLNRFNTTDLFEILSQVFFLSFEYILLENLNILINLTFLLSLFLNSAVLLKSAQFIFYPWLLDAMEAPVPISAQLHSSTLVIIGFYIYFRFQNLVILSPWTSSILLLFGTFTIVYMSILGFFQEDGKKLLACSTASQLGYVITGLGFCYFEESILMLIFCCCNKAITFIWFGILMDKYSGISDIRVIGGSTTMSWLEHAGILISLANFTIIPGAFSWQIKSLYLKGQYSYDYFFNSYCLDIIFLTWFFGSLYFFYLYISIFLKPIRLSIGKNYNYNYGHSTKNTTILSFVSKLVILFFLFFKIKITLFLKLYKINLLKLFSYSFVDNRKNIKLFFLNSFWFSVIAITLTWFFFFLLLIGIFYLINFDFFLFNSTYDSSWMGDYLLYYNFILDNFYKF